MWAGRAELWDFHSFPKAHGERLQTTNLVESVFVKERIQVAQPRGGVMERRASR